MNMRVAAFIFCFVLLLHCLGFGQNVVIVVIDGARYTETFGAESLYMPKIWNELRPQGTFWTDFRNNGITATSPGHASIITGTWQHIGHEDVNYPAKPTIFEYFRKATNAPEKSTAVIVGKSKLEILSYSTNTEYGAEYKSFLNIGKDDTSVVNILKSVLTRNHPKITLVNLPDVDNGGHSGEWKKYISALRTADSLVYEIWQALQADSVYRGNTTLFVTNDHGRHDDSHLGFKKHGDSCDGCRHIMLLAVGRGFPAGRSITGTHTLCDIAPTVGELLSFPVKYAKGTSLLRDTVSSVK
jgi:membrane-anchored protein YejM (alkaline phosphatase superfamily)